MKHKLICSVLHLEAAAKLIEPVNPELCLTLLKTAKFVAETYCIEQKELEEAKDTIAEIEKTTNDEDTKQA